jgi:hypothetical protein
MILELANRWWVLPDTTLTELLNRTEAGDLTAEEAYALLIEHSDTEHS